MIVRGEKRVENRTWPTRHRGPIYIHAGKSRAWLGVGDEDKYQNMPFGAVVAIATLVDCVTIGRIEMGDFDKIYPWLRKHEHAFGPWCWILDSVTPIGPWPWRGAQGLFDIDSGELGRVANKELGIAEPSEART